MDKEKKKENGQDERKKIKYDEVIIYSQCVLHISIHIHMHVL